MVERRESITERHHVVGLLLHFSRVQIEASIGETVIAVSAPGPLVLGDETSLLVVLGVALATSILLERTLPCKIGQADLILLDTVLMSIYAIWSCTSSPVLAELHVGLRFRVGYEKYPLVIIHVVFPTRHGDDVKVGIDLVCVPFLITKALVFSTVFFEMDVSCAAQVRDGWMDGIHAMRRGGIST